VDAGADAGEDVQVDSAGVQLVLEENEEFLHRARDPVRLVDHQRVTGLELVQGGVQLGSLPAGAGGLDDHLPTKRGGERVELRLVILRRGGDAGVADADAVVVRDGGGHPADRPGYRPETG
jgi:hypothetical protein